ncbi:hypothetical protein OUZ56_010994 [Daphnia magna]|uniref:Uncharacterized protein n=1 Tax=Daphnia magna TaxID=35525 RepID=A0ABQ9YZ40_9CRUS|nr:hypothetical protein OUZ56_010994 [Daphnia magna]
MLLNASDAKCNKGYRRKIEETVSYANVKTQQRRLRNQRSSLHHLLKCNALIRSSRHLSNSVSPDEIALIDQIVTEQANREVLEYCN